mmetsp:Transcript_13084/g.39611  ORF Transcript_13084/g.39611 Transcript_13084/m.39611 type:complete len:222 (+) Transcript_13084:2478-3143(+)
MALGGTSKAGLASDALDTGAAAFSAGGHRNSCAVCTACPASAGVGDRSALLDSSTVPSGGGRLCKDRSCSCCCTAAAGRFAEGTPAATSAGGCCSCWRGSTIGGGSGWYMWMPAAAEIGTAGVTVPLAMSAAEGCTAEDGGASRCGCRGRPSCIMERLRTEGCCPGTRRGCASFMLLDGLRGCFAAGAGPSLPGSCGRRSRGRWGCLWPGCCRSCGGAWRA